MSLLLLLGAHPLTGAAHGQSTVAGNFPGRINLAMGANGVATVGGALGVAIRFKQSATGTATTAASTLTVPLSALAVGDLVVVATVANYGPNSVTGTGITFSSPTSAHFFYGKVTSAGGTGVTVNWTAGTPMNVHVMVFANADVALDDSLWNSTGTSNTPSVGSNSYNFGNGTAPVAAGNLVVAVAQWNTTAALSSTGGGFTSTSADIGATTTFRSVAAWRVYASTTQSPAASWTVSATTTWQGNAIVIVPTQASVPAAPKPQIYHQANGAQLDWDIVPGATAGYKVYESGVLVATVNGGFTTGASTQTVVNISGLSPGASKSYTVRAVNSFGESADSTAMAFVAATCPTWTVRNKYPATNPPTVAATTQQVTNTSTAGQAYAVSVLIPDATISVSSVTGAGATWQRAARVASGAMSLEIWYALNVPGGADTITVTVSSSCLFNIDLVAVSNVDGAEGFGTTSGGSGGSTFAVPAPASSTDGALYVALVGELDISASNQSLTQTLPFADNAMTNGATVSSRTYFVSGLGAGSDPRLGSGLLVGHSPTTAWGAVYLVFTRAKVQLASTPTGAGGGSGSLSVGHSSVTLAATPASVATASAAVRVTRTVRGSAASVATSSADFKVLRRLASVAAGLGAVTSAIAVKRSFVSTSAGQGAASVSLAVRRALAAAVAGHGAGSAAMAVRWSLSANSTALASVLGNSAVSHPLSAMSVAVSSTAAAVAVRRSIAAAVHGVAVVSGAPVVRLVLVGSSAAGGAVSADATVIPAGLAGDGVGRAGVAGTAGVTYSVTAGAAGQAAVVGSPAMRRGLLAAVAGTGASAADVALRRALVATASGDAACVVSTSVLRAMSANSSAIATVAGGARVRYVLSAAPAGAAEAGAVLIKGPLLAGRGDGLASSQGAARITRTLAVAIAGHGLVSSTASQVFSLTSACHGAAVTLSAFGLIRPVAGSTAGSASVTATGAVRRSLRGAVVGQAGQSAAMVFRVRLGAQVDGAATTSGAVLRDRGFVVSVAGVGHAAGTLWDTLPQIAGHAMVLVPRELSPTQRLVAQGSVLVLEARGTGEGVRALDRAMTLTADAAI